MCVSNITCCATGGENYNLCVYLMLPAVPQEGRMLTYVCIECRWGGLFVLCVPNKSNKATNMVLMQRIFYPVFQAKCSLSLFKYSEYQIVLFAVLNLKDSPRDPITHITKTPHIIIITCQIFISLQKNIAYLKCWFNLFCGTNHLYFILREEGKENNFVLYQVTSDQQHSVCPHYIPCLHW